MNKLIVISILILNMLFLGSCFKWGGAKGMINKRLDMLNSSSDEKKAEIRIKQVIEAIKKKDKDALKAMFSKHALSEADDMNGRMDYLFELFPR